MRAAVAARLGALRARAAGALLAAPAILAVSAAATSVAGGIGGASRAYAEPVLAANRASLGSSAPRKIAYEVSRERSPDGAAWIDMRADFETVYPFGIEEIVAVLEDYEGTPEVFSRVESVKLRSKEGDTAITEQVSAVRILGLAFISKLAFRVETEWAGPGRAVVSFHAIETDGSAYLSDGSWELEAMDVGGSRSTYLRYRLETWAEPRFPGQEGIMRAFGAGDFQRTLRELGAALRRRAGGRSAGSGAAPRG